jgi:hypothetical protein
MRSFQLLLALAFVLPAAALPAAPIYFNSRAAFNAAINGSLTSQSFETPFGTASPVNFPGFSMAETGGFDAIASADSSFMSSVGLSNGITDGTRAVFFDDNDDSVMTFSFTGPINAFGVDITTDQAQTLAVGGDLGTSIAMGVNTPTFFGAIDFSGTFQTFTFTSTGGPNIGFDLVTFGNVTAAEVPEPVSLALWGMISIGLAVGARHRTKRMD